MTDTPALNGAGNGKAPVILCVDDENIILSSLSEQLRGNFERTAVETAESGEEGLEVFQELRDEGVPVPVVVSDQLMPGMRGEDFLEAVHEMEPATLNILLTGQATADAVGAAVNRASLYRYIGKPWTETDLILTIREAMKAWSQAEALKRKEQELREAHNASLRFVPREFLGLLGRERLVDVNLGDHVQREMQVLFADIRDYTRQVEGFDPSSAFGTLNEFVGILEGSLREEGGFLNGLEGDGVLGLFAGSADDAVRAGARAHRLLRERNEASGTTVPLAMGVGVNTGPLLLGTVGNADRLKCDVVGDAVNLCARIESLTRRFDTGMLISDKTQQKLTDDHGLREIGAVRVKGRAEALSLFEVLDALPAADRQARQETLEPFACAVSQFRHGELARSMAGFEDILAADPGDGVARAYREQCRCLIGAGEGADPRGVINFMSK